MPKVTKIINGEYIGGEKYTITDAGEGKSIISFTPDTVLKEGTPIGAEILNEMQKNSVYSLIGTRNISGQKEIYTCNVDGINDFGLFDIVLIMTPNLTNTTQNIYLDLSGNEFKIVSNNIISVGDLQANEPYIFKLTSITKKAFLIGNDKLKKGTYPGKASDLDTDIKKCVSGANTTGSIDISISNPATLTSTKFYRMDGTSPYHPSSGLGTMAGIHIQHPTVLSNAIEIQIPFDGTSRMFVKNSGGVQEVARTGGLNKTLNDVNVDLTTLSGNFTNFKTTVESNYISGINESGTGNKKDTTLAGVKSGFYRWEGSNMPIVDAVGLVNIKHPYSENIGSFLAMTFTGEAKMWVGNTQWGFIELVNKSYLEAELVNSTTVRSTTGTYPLSNNLSSNYKFINIIFGDTSGGWRQYIKIPFADRKSAVVAYGVSATTASETAIVSFPSDSTVSYSIQNLAGDNQVCLYKVWQSNV